MYPFPRDYFEVIDSEAFAASGLVLPEPSDGQNVVTTVDNRPMFKNMKLESFDSIATLVALVATGKVIRYTPEQAVGRKAAQ